MDPTSSAAPLLQFRNATVILGGKRVLDRLNLSIAEGEHTAILGPNGSGKSSLLKLLTRTYLPVLYGRSPFGEDAPVAIFGRSRFDTAEMRQQLGIVTADAHAEFTSSDLAGEEAVLTGFFASRGIFPHMRVTEAMRQQAREALASVEVGHLAERPVAEMSTGEARRVLIARALAHNPRALVLDEPTTGLDLVAARRFIETVHRLMEGGRTVILVTHHVEEIPPAIRRVVLLKAGAIFRDGPKEEVLTSPTLSALFDAPVSVSHTNGYYTATADL